MTKTELLFLMRKYFACVDATEYVTDHPSDDAQVIWQDCRKVDWLIWFLARHNREALQPLLFAAADRAVRQYAADALDAAGVQHGLRSLEQITDERTAHTATSAAYSASHSASHAASYAAASSHSASHSASHAASYASRAASYAASYAAAAAAYTSAAAAAAYAAERELQLVALHEVVL